ncbi:MAG: peptide ABC transporter substrate-binding protein [Bdellovibrio sp.]
MKKVISLLSFLAPLVWLFGLQADPSNQELIIGVDQEFETLNPAINQSVIGTYILAMTLRNIGVINADGKWVPLIVKEFPTLKNKKAKIVNGKIVMETEILESAKWSDGKPVVCDDFAFTRELGLTKTVSVGGREKYERIEKIEWSPQTPKKCTWTFKEARWDFFHLGTYHPLPAHLERPILEKFGKENGGYEKNSLYTRQPTTPGLSNGPYMFSEFKQGSHVSLVRNPHFYGKPAAIEKVTFRIIPNSGTLEANLRSGTIDMVGIIGLTFDQAVSLEKKVAAEKMDIRVLFQPGLTYEHIDFNLDNPVLKDLRVRKALVHAIHRDELVKALFEGKQPKAIHNITEADRDWFTADPKKVVLYPFDRKKAAALLEEAGWKMGSSGVREKDGKRLSLPFSTTAGNKIRETVQVFLQNQWKAVGVEVLVKNEPARVFFGETMRKRKFEALAMYAWVSSPGVPFYSTLLSDSIPSESNGFSGQNYPGWRNAKVDALMTQIKTEMNEGKRKDIIHQVLREYTEEVPTIPLYYRSEIAVIPKNLKGYRITGHQFYDSYFVENWSLQ